MDNFHFRRLHVHFQSLIVAAASNWQHRSTGEDSFVSRRNRENWNLDFVVAVVTLHLHCPHSLSIHPAKETRSGTADSDRLAAEISSPPWHRHPLLRRSMTPPIAAVTDSRTFAVARLCSTLVPVRAYLLPTMPMTMSLSVAVVAAAAVVVVDHLMLAEPVNWFRPSMREGLRVGDGLRALCPDSACHVCAVRRSFVLLVQMVRPTKRKLTIFYNKKTLKILTRLDLYKLLMSNC